MTTTSKLMCRIRLSDLPTPTPAVVRRTVDCDLWIDGRDEKSSLIGTLIGRLDGPMIVEGIKQDDLNIGPVKAAELLLAIYEDSGIGDGGESHTRSVMDFEVTDDGGGILGKAACDLRDTVWT